jgi:hypothetical protein
MKLLLHLALLFTFALGVPARAAAKPQEETVFLFENRRVIVLVPDGFGFASTKDPRGMMTVEIGHPKDKVRLTITFLPDPEQAFMTARTRKEFINEQYGEFVESSVEKAMQFEELDPKFGAGTFCVFTDEKLVGKSKFPPGEYLHFVSGVKAWPGVAAVFRLFTNDTQSKEYQAILAMLRTSVAENVLSPLL